MTPTIIKSEDTSLHKNIEKFLFIQTFTGKVGKVAMMG